MCEEEEVPGDPARLHAVLERLAGDTRAALVDAARAAVETDAFDGGAATFRAGLAVAAARAIVHLVRAPMQADGFDVYEEAEYTTLGTTHAVRIVFGEREHKWMKSG